MDFANRANRPVQQPVQTNEPMMAPAPQKSSGSDKGSKKGFNLGKVGSIALLFGIAILAASLVYMLIFGGSSENKESELINSDKYQAVFLNSQDGQVYFGKLSIYNNDMYVLNDIYYVRVEQKVQPEGSKSDAQQNISLAKLGNELHGPEDFMYIRRDQVLFWENLKDDGQVGKAIADYKANGEKPADTTQTQQSTTQQSTTQQSTTTDTTNTSDAAQN